MQIRLVANSDKKRWDDFVRNHPDGSPFHLYAWHDAVVKAFGHNPFYYLAEKDNTAITGVLPLFQLKSLIFGHILSSVPFAAYGGILADTDETFQLLLAKAREMTRECGADYLELKFFHDRECDMPASGLHYGFIKKIAPDHEANMKAIPRKQRAMIRKGMKAGLTAHVGNEYLDAFYDVFSRNVHQLGTPVYPKRWFRTLLEEFGPDAEVMVVKSGETLVSGVLSIYYKETVLPYYAGSLARYRASAPSDFQYWELMRRAAERGCRYFDFGRSKKDSGHFRFKKHWGFEPQPLHYCFFLHKLKELPEINPRNPRYRKKIATWKKLPLGLTKLLGPHIVKYIP